MRKKIHWIHQWVPNLWPDAYMELIINLVSDSYKYLSFKCPARTLDFLNPNLCHPLALHPSKWNPHLSSFSNNNRGTNPDSPLPPGTPNIIHHHLSCPEYVPKPLKALPIGSWHWPHCLRGTVVRLWLVCPFPLLSRVPWETSGRMCS